MKFNKYLFKTTIMYTNAHDALTHFLHNKLLTTHFVYLLNTGVKSVPKLLTYNTHFIFLYRKRNSE